MPVRERVRAIPPGELIVNALRLLSALLLFSIPAVFTPSPVLAQEAWEARYDGGFAGGVEKAAQGVFDAQGNVYVTGESIKGEQIGNGGMIVMARETGGAFSFQTDDFVLSLDADGSVEHDRCRAGSA